MGLTKKNFYKKPDFVLTTSWDDGGKYDLSIANLLKKYNLPGTFYITLDYIGKEGYMNWDQIKELDKQGFEIGSHTVSHPPDLKECYGEALFVEVQSSKDMLEAALDHKIESFCYPRGRMNDRVKDAVMEAGYLNARGTGKPGTQFKESNYNLPGTIHIFQREEYGDKSILEFAKEVIDRLVKEGGYCNIWGHSNEIEKDNNFNILEEVLKYASEKTQT